MPNEQTPQTAGVRLDVVRQWLDGAGRRGFYWANTLYAMRTALEQLLSVADDAEADDPEKVLEIVEDLGNRWARREKALPATVRAYIGRSRRLLIDFLEYQRNPTAFRPKSRRKQELAAENGSPTARPRRRAATKPDSISAASAAAGAEATAPTPMPTGVAEETLHLRPDMRIRVQIPRDLTTAEARRYVFLLAGYLPEVATWLPREKHQLAPAEDVDGESGGDC